MVKKQDDMIGNIIEQITNLNEVIMGIDNKINAMNGYYAKTLTIQNDYIQTLNKMNDIIIEIHSKMFPKTEALELKKTAKKKAVKKKK